MPIRSIAHGRDRSATAGARDKVVTIQERPEAISKDTSGTPVDGPWTTHLDPVFAERIDLDGRERWNAQQLTSPFDTRWRIPYSASMDPELVNVPKLRRILYHDRVMDIVYARHLGRQEGIELQTITTNKEPE